MTTLESVIMGLRSSSPACLLSLFVASAFAACGGASTNDLFTTPDDRGGSSQGGKLGGSVGGTDAGRSSAGEPSRGGSGANAGERTGGTTSSGGRGGLGGGGSGGRASGGGLAGRAGNAGMSGAGEAGQAGSGGVDCTALVRDLEARLLAAQDCRLDVGRLTCVGLVTDPCGCTHPVDLQNSSQTKAYEAAVKSLGQQCVIYCPDRVCTTVTESHCAPEAGGEVARCAPAESSAD